MHAYGTYDSDKRYLPYVGAWGRAQNDLQDTMHVRKVPPFVHTEAIIAQPNA